MNRSEEKGVDVDINLRVIAVTQPRRVAAITVAQRVSKERNGNRIHDHDDSINDDNDNNNHKNCNDDDNNNDNNSNNNDN